LRPDDRRLLPPVGEALRADPADRQNAVLAVIHRARVTMTDATRRRFLTELRRPRPDASTLVDILLAARYQVSRRDVKRASNIAATYPDVSEVISG
jgi:hypothetical protein